MQILLTIGDDVDSEDARIIAETLENEPWCRKAQVISGCSGKSPCLPCSH